MFARPFRPVVSEENAPAHQNKELTCEMRSTCLGTQALVFVVDSADRARIDEAKTELHRIINDREMKDTILLVFANKQDIAGGMPFHPFSHHQCPLTCDDG